MTPRRWFHLLLGAVFIPLLSLPLVWGVAISWLRRAADVEARRWAKRMLWLALVDTLVVIVGGVLVAAEMEPTEPPATAVEDRVVIGVRPDLSFSGAGARVEDVHPGGPAAAAGLEAGDVIIRVAGKEISGHEALRSAVGEQEPGVPISLDVKRGPSTTAVSITPRWSSELSPRTPGLFDPVGQLACFPPPSAPGLLQLAIVLAATAVLAALVAWRGSVSGSARGVWWTGLSLVSAGVAGYAVPAGACVMLGGQTAAGLVFAPWGSSLALAGTALVARRFVGDGRASTPTRTWGSAVALGSWYMITGAPRLAVFLYAVMQLAPGQETGSHPLESLAQGLATAQGPGLLLLAVPVVLFAPVGEELAFRGLLQPALGGWLKPAAAVALTSLLFASMHWYYGLRLPLLVLIAAVLGWARIVTGGLRAPIVLHMLVNAVGFVPIFLQAGRLQAP
jgi:membrane protease YdiL (CAAX protease family)